LTHCFPNIARNAEKRGCETCVKQRLGGNDFGQRSGPGGCVGVCVGEEGVVHGVDEDLHVGSGCAIRVRF